MKAVEIREEESIYLHSLHTETKLTRGMITTKTIKKHRTNSEMSTGGRPMNSKLIIGAATTKIKTNVQDESVPQIRFHASFEITNEVAC